MPRTATTSSRETRRAPREALLRREEAEQLHQALGRLTEEQRQILRLKCDEDLTYAQIGEYLGCSAEAARKRVRRTVRELEELMRPDAER